ncbi:MAG: glycosyltransferase family 8 protein [Synergistaceae bacterium]|jgi:lipopolysaccharide biosynthesis glycosyltransferase|nr:glycosyltransferase family 8 protein [Synergistaceae bacterium]
MERLEISEENKLAGDVIHVVLAVYDPKGTYARHAGVVMASIFERTRNPVRVHILHDQTLTEHNRVLLTETAESYGQSVEFHDVMPHMGQLGEDAIKLAQQWSIGTLFRLLIVEVLLLDKVIYLDCDVVVNMNIRELWDIAVDNCALAGVLDRPANKPYRRISAKAFRFKHIGCDQATYINAGVLSINLYRIRKKYNLTQEIVPWFSRHKRYIDTVDQDLINSYFRGDIKIIDGRFNNGHVFINANFCDDLNDPRIANSILHAILSPKPWEALKGFAMDRLYWRTFLKTPWGRLEPEKIVDLMIDVAEKSPLTHRRTYQCYKRIFFRWRKDIFLNDIVVIVWFMMQELYDKIKSSLIQRKIEKI